MDGRPAESLFSSESGCFICQVMLMMMVKVKNRPDGRSVLQFKKCANVHFSSQIPVKQPHNNQSGLKNQIPGKQYI